MEFSEQIKSLVARIPKLSENVSTEEATKNALIMPLINVLGYNVFDPTEVIPEYTADHGTKKGEKVDYAIVINGEPLILFECKDVNSELSNQQASQLFRYYSVTPAKVGILTNGIIYRFFSDLDSPNKMDDKPFLEINMLNLREKDIQELKRFTKESFDPDDLTSVAISLKYTHEIMNILQEELENPSDDFVRFFAKRVYDRPLKKNTLERFRTIVKDARNQFINEKINNRLKLAMSDHKEEQEETSENGTPEEDNGIVTTVEELEAYYIVRGILREIIPANRVSLRDTKGYCGILLDNTNRKPICRLRFNTKQKHLGVFNDNKKEEKIPINDLADLYNYSDSLKNIIKLYDSQ
ncbi:hypothetical protein J2128_000181 [Methanomicrobium sp. W14]|uniref:type I restriction endonuclease n=1 Tax=Methanomicrobium sp. W14 TaxID=2817839 RepID=UPI001AE943CC|nr:type I restriction endonuclease [Methanomicrobium sp. W14]MBP2132260.1 hypothetical protein [Methanomicrobium sp. W14]